MDTTKINAVYDQDTYRYHRFLIQESEGIKGSLYINKDADVPDEITVKLKTKLEMQNQS